jgi:hypothetical protein
VGHGHVPARLADRRTGQTHGVAHAVLRKELGGPAAAIASTDQLQERINRAVRVGRQADRLASSRIVRIRTPVMHQRSPAF